MHSRSHNSPNAIDGINSDHFSALSATTYACAVSPKGAFTTSNTTICAIVHITKPTHRSIR